MTHLETAIRDAVEKGGYKFGGMTKKQFLKTWYIFVEKTLLDPAFWASLGKAREWFEWETCAKHHNDGVDTEDYDEKCPICVWHRLIDTLASGDSVENFFKTL